MRACVRAFVRACVCVFVLIRPGSRRGTSHGETKARPAIAQGPSARRVLTRVSEAQEAGARDATPVVKARGRRERERELFIQEGNRAPVSEATHMHGAPCF